MIEIASGVAMTGTEEIETVTAIGTATGTGTMIETSTRDAREVESERKLAGEGTALVLIVASVGGIVARAVVIAIAEVVGSYQSYQTNVNCTSQIEPLHHKHAQRTSSFNVHTSLTAARATLQL